MKNYIYVQGVGFVRKETKNSFRNRKVMESIITRGLYFCNKPSQETDLN